MSDKNTENVVRRLSRVRERLHAGMDRREFVRTLASAGYAVGMAHFLGVDDFLETDDGDVPVVTALVRERDDDPFSLEKRTRTVPAEWYAAVEKAFEVNDLLAKSKVMGYLGSAVVPGDYRSGTASVTIGLTGDASFVGDVLGTVADDIGLDIERFDDGDDDGFETIEEFRNGRDGVTRQPRLARDGRTGTAPGGVTCETDSSMATLGPAMYDPESKSEYFVTAEHAFDAEDAVVGEALTLPTESEESFDLGTVSVDHPVADLVAVEPSGELEPINQIDTSPPSSVRGQFTRWGLADLLARGEPLEKVGAMTGHTTGEIQGIDAVTCFTDDFCRHGQIRWGGEMDLIDGDSGSVSYHPDPENPEEGILIAGFNNARTWWPGQSYVWGISAYQVTNSLGYHF
ncbi:hypothetical protein HALLA_08890 [Halostagnicola larsenii XH-48]|uniref:Uncharacterized protein n=1 Tax=Halostagnicola larsenii XH-48 TaxID=797299 RepID=W0JNU4_9EURY|nr:hypothetical protein [Halostagnicola larsenii]AHF98966.1 hypothetical protein HALLA_08890 [Halostagnicola larsenii XH-48]